MRPVDWTSTPREKRHRKPLEVTLSDDERDIADYLSEQHNTAKSRVVGAGLMTLSKMSHTAREEAISKAEREVPKRKTTTKGRKK